MPITRAWDMAWLRIDWNGNGYDAFVTDNNLARVRVSHAVKEPPKPEQWTLLTFTWDETDGVALYLVSMMRMAASWRVQQSRRCLV